MIASVCALHVIPIVASSKTLLVRGDCVSSEMSTTVACGWPSINKQMHEAVLNKYSIEFHLVLISALPQSHSIRECRVRLFG